MVEYPWYEIVDANTPLDQGDFIDMCPLVVPAKTKATLDEENELTVEGREISANVIVMSQTCDLAHEKIKLVLLCPYWDFPRIYENHKRDYKEAEFFEAVRKGHFVGLHLLEQCELDNFERGHVVVGFKNIYSAHMEFMRDYITLKEQRLRLLPPYREHLSQAFARVFMRVGLPQDITSPFTK